MKKHEFRDVCIAEVLGGKSHLVWLRLLKVLFSLNASRKAVLYIRLAQMFQKANLGLIFKWLQYRLASRFGIHIHFSAELGSGLRLPHPTSIVIGQGVVIGQRCLIYQQVTIGASPQHDEEKMPRTGDDVTLYPGVKFVGLGRVGSRVVVGANAVVADVFGDDVVIAGVPARVVRSLRAGDRVGATGRL